MKDTLKEDKPLNKGEHLYIYSNIYKITSKRGQSLWHTRDKRLGSNWVHYSEVPPVAMVTYFLHNTDLLLRDKKDSPCNLDDTDLPCHPTKRD